MTKIDLESENTAKIEKIQALIDTGEISSQALAAHIVAYRALGMDKDVATLCMMELATRRKNGSDFDFEKFVDEELAKIPKIPVMDIKSLTGNLNIQTIMKMMKR